MYVDKDIYLREANKITGEKNVTTDGVEAEIWSRALPYTKRLPITQRRSFVEKRVLHVELKVPEVVWSDWEKPRSRHSRYLAPDMKVAHIKHIV
jgi:hypothetical protein